MEAQEGPTAGKGKRKVPGDPESSGTDGKLPVPDLQTASSLLPEDRSDEEEVLELGQVRLEVTIDAKEAPALHEGAAIALKRAPTSRRAEDEDGEGAGGQRQQRGRWAERPLCMEVLRRTTEAAKAGCGVVLLQETQPLCRALVSLVEHEVIEASFSIVSVSRAVAQQQAVTLGLVAEVRQSVSRSYPSICHLRRAHLSKALSLYCQLMRPEGAEAEEAMVPLRLVDVFEEMTASDHDVKGDQQKRRERRNAIIARYLEQQQEQQGSSGGGSGPSGLMSVSDEVLGLLFSFLQPRDLSALGHSSRFLLDACSTIVPGLRARLYPHQSRCLDWMLEREEPMGGAGLFPHPAYRQLSCRDGREVYVDLTDGEVALSPAKVPKLYDCRGGMLCDEPGLGKTVTALALILARRGRLPAAPRGYVSQHEEDGGQEEKAGGGAAVMMAGQQHDSTGGGKRRFSFRSPGSRRREMDPRALIGSSATLIVVPGPLVNHWREQIERHAEPWALPRVYYEHHDQGPPPGQQEQQQQGGRRRLPPAEVLSQYDVVVLSKERLSYEWATGKPPCALEARVPLRYAEKFEDAPRADRVSELLKVRWLRIIVDEGHALGTLAVTDAALMASCLESERRWVMTGTPTRHDANDMRSLRALLAFLREPVFGRRDGSGEEVFASLITRCPHQWLVRDRLRALLRRVMIRHTKACIPEIPKPIIRLRRLRMSRLEARTYNNFVSLVHANLITTGMAGGSHAAGAAHPDSLLNPRNYRLATTTMENVRMACCGGGLQEIELTQHNFVETLNLTRTFGGEAQAQAKVLDFMRRARDGRLSTCERCGVRTSLMLVTPYCFHLLCGGCMEGRNNVCAKCGRAFSVDDFQSYQPGFSMRWKEFELQLVDGMKVLKPLGAAKEEEDDENDDDGSWDVMSKVKHTLDVLHDYQQQLRTARPSSSSGSPPLRPLKALVFSQFKTNLTCLSAALKSQGWGVAEFFGAKRAAHLEAFVHNPDVHVLLSGREGSHGLDLSFLTHIILFEEIWDAGLEDQVVSRAYRMGARKPAVVVEKLRMVGSVEEVMHALRAQPAAVSTAARQQQHQLLLPGPDQLSSSPNAAFSSSSSSSSPAPASGPSSPPPPPSTKTNSKKRARSGSSSSSKSPARPGRSKASSPPPASSPSPSPQSQQARELSKLHYLLQRLSLVRAEAIRHSNSDPPGLPDDNTTHPMRTSASSSPTPPPTSSSSSPGGRPDQASSPTSGAASHGQAQQGEELPPAAAAVTEAAPIRRVRFADE